MSVYVDNANIAASVPNGQRVHTSHWCHLMADTLPELETFRQAVALGAVEIETRTDEWIRVVAAARAQYEEASR